MCARTTDNERLPESPDATAHTIDAEGWLHTGDVGYADADDHFFIVDRAKELISTKDFRLRRRTRSNPADASAVADTAVIPIPDDEAGEIPKAYVVLNCKAEAEEILDFVAARVASFKKIRLIEFIDRIPKSASGKILRRVLIESERANEVITTTPLRYKATFQEIKSGMSSKNTCRSLQKNS
jgi:acyl-CoA synthetase (AMP-forming)/AMP-acid ligase II